MEIRRYQSDAGKFVLVSKEAFLEAQKQKDARDFLKARKNGFILVAMRRLQIGGADAKEPERAV